MGTRISDLIKRKLSGKDALAFDGANGTGKIDFEELLWAVASVIDVGHVGVHNALYRGKDITSYFEDESLYARIKGTNGFKPYEDLFVGDYVRMPHKVCVVGDECDGAGTNIVKIAGLGRHHRNYYSFTEPHATMIPDTNFGDCQPMNDSATTVGGYLNSKMNKTIIGDPATSGNANGTINQQLLNIFGSHLKTVKEFVSNAVDAARYNRFGQATGAASGWAWMDAQAILMSEIEVYGSVVWGSSGYDIGTAKSQLPIFRLSIEDMINGQYYWLRDVASAEAFCNVSNFGGASYGAADIEFCLRPRFIIG